LKKLEDVKEDVTELFNDAAKMLVDRFKGDKDKALKSCLAYISGHYQTTLVGRSLLTGQEKQTTLELTFYAEPARGMSAQDKAW